MGHQLTGLTACTGKAQTVHNVIQAAFHQDQQVFTGFTGHAGGLLIVRAELALHNAIHKFHFLLFSQLKRILALLLSHLAAGVAVGCFLRITHNSRRNAQSVAAFGDRLHILSHNLFSPFD